MNDSRIRFSLQFHNNGTVLNRSKVLALGGCTSIITTAGKFREESILIAVAFKCIKILARNIDCASALHDAGACDLVVKCMDCDVPYVQEAAILSFVNLANNSDLSMQRLFALGGFDKIVDQFKMRISDARIIFACCLALNAILFDERILKRVLALKLKLVLQLLQKVIHF